MAGSLSILDYLDGPAKTYTPSMTTLGSGAVWGTCTGRYRKMKNGLWLVMLDCTLTTVGSATNYFEASMPVVDGVQLALLGNWYLGTGIEIAATRKQLSVSVQGSTIRGSYYDGTSGLFSTAHYVFGAIFEATAGN